MFPQEILPVGCAEREKKKKRSSVWIDCCVNDINEQQPPTTFKKNKQKNKNIHLLAQNVKPETSATLTDIFMFFAKQFHHLRHHPSAISLEVYNCLFRFAKQMSVCFGLRADAALKGLDSRAVSCRLLKVPIVCKRPAIC